MTSGIRLAHSAVLAGGHRILYAQQGLRRCFHRFSGSCELSMVHKGTTLVIKSPQPSLHVIRIEAAWLAMLLFEQATKVLH